jgi:HAMP domain-containing protein
MSLLVRVNLALVVVFAIGASVTGLACQQLLARNAAHEVRAEAELMMDGALAARDYTDSEVAPLLAQQLQTQFLPQAVPFYAATEHFLRLHAHRPEYSYQEATLNPMNPRDRATDWQADIIRHFRDDPSAAELFGERATPMGRSLYLARPIRASADCLGCHGSAAAAPRTIIARYGSSNGFGWQAGEVIGAQVVSVPSENAERRAEQAFHAFLASLAAVFLALLLVVNLVLYLLVVRPVRRMAEIADRLSVGDALAPEFPTTGGAEIAGLGRSFNRMRKSLDKALRLLESAR